MKVSKIILLIAVLGIWNHAAEAFNKKDFVKLYKKDFNVTPNGSVILNNKYGKIDVKTWDKNQMAISVRVTVKAEDEGTANSTFNRIKIYFSSGTDFVKGETRIEEPGVWDNMKSMWGGACDYTIDYEVYMPITNKLDLKNKYGNAYVAALNSSANIDLKYGNLRMESIDGALKANLAYGEGNITNANSISGNISYGQLNIDNAKDINLNTSYSEFAITKANDITIQSAYDTYVIGTSRDLHLDAQYGDYKVQYADKLVANLQYTDITMKKLGNSATIDAQYGDIKIASIAKGFSDITIDGQYTDVALAPEIGANYRLDAQTTYADISTPAAFRHNIDKERGSSREVVGLVGGNSNTKSFIKARLSYGDLSIK